MSLGVLLVQPRGPITDRYFGQAPPPLPHFLWRDQIGVGKGGRKRVSGIEKRGENLCFYAPKGGWQGITANQLRFVFGGRVIPRGGQGSLFCPPVLVESACMKCCDCGLGKRVVVCCEPAFWYRFSGLKTRFALKEAL